MKYKNSKTRNTYLEFLRECGSICIRNPHEPPWHLRNGGRSRIYIDHAKISCDYESFITFVSAIKDIIPQRKFFTLCNVDSKISAQLAGALAYILKAPQIIFKSDELTRIEKGPMQQLTVPKKITEPIIIVDDVGSTGGTVIHVAELLRGKIGHDLKIILLISLVRDPEVLSEALHKNNINFKYVVTLDELLTYHWKSLRDWERQAVLSERPHVLKLIKK